MGWGNTDLTLRLPPEIEEWAEELIEQVDGVERVVRAEDALIVEFEMGGNTYPLGIAASFLREVEEALEDGHITPAWIELKARKLSDSDRL